MTAATDWTTICTILKGSNPTGPQVRNVADLFAETDASATNEQRAAAAIAGMRAWVRSMLREKAAREVYSAALGVAHYPSEQPALLAAAQVDADAAGASAEASL